MTQCVPWWGWIKNLVNSPLLDTQIVSSLCCYKQWKSSLCTDISTFVGDYLNIQILVSKHKCAFFVRFDIYYQIALQSICIVHSPSNSMWKCLLPLTLAKPHISDIFNLWCSGSLVFWQLLILPSHKCFWTKRDSISCVN